MRKTLIVAVVIGLLAGALVGPAQAKKKKGKKKAPVTFTADGTLAIGNPGDLNEAGIVRQEFLATCAVPASQGLDGYVIEVSEEISKVTSEAKLSGSDATGMYDLDMYFYDDACASKGSSSTAESDEFGFMPAGTKYVFVSAFMGAEVAFTFEAIETKTAGF